MTKKLKQEFQTNYINIWRQILLNLLRESKRQDYWLDNSQEYEKSCIEKWTQINSEWLLVILFLTKTILYYLFKNYAQAAENAIRGEKYAEGSPYVVTPQKNFYLSLALIAQYPNVDNIKQK